MSSRWHRWLPFALLGAVACNFNPQPDLPASPRDSMPGAAGGSAGNGSLTSAGGSGGSVDTGVPNSDGGLVIGPGAGGVGSIGDDAGAGGVLEEAGAAGASVTSPPTAR